MTKETLIIEDRSQKFYDLNAKDPKAARVLSYANRGVPVLRSLLFTVNSKGRATIRANSKDYVNNIIDEIIKRCYVFCYEAKTVSKNWR